MKTLIKTFATVALAAAALTGARGGGPALRGQGLRTIVDPG
jgi:hypothetical protein